MKCPNDQSEMEEGVVQSNRWLRKENFWFSGYILLPIGPKVKAYKCPKCGKVDFYTEISKEEDKTNV